LVGAGGDADDTGAAFCASCPATARPRPEAAETTTVSPAFAGRCR